jgi:hypothetical protein
MPNALRSKKSKVELNKPDVADASKTEDALKPNDSLKPADAAAKKNGPPKVEESAQVPTSGSPPKTSDAKPVKDSEPGSEAAPDNLAKEDVALQKETPSIPSADETTTPPGDPITPPNDPILPGDPLLPPNDPITPPETPPNEPTEPTDASLGRLAEKPDPPEPLADKPGRPEPLAEKPERPEPLAEKPDRSDPLAEKPSQISADEVHMPPVGYKPCRSGGKEAPLPPAVKAHNTKMRLKKQSTLPQEPPKEDPNAPKGQENNPNDVPPALALALRHKDIVAARSKPPVTPGVQRYIKLAAGQSGEGEPTEDKPKLPPHLEKAWRAMQIVGSRTPEGRALAAAATGKPENPPKEGGPPKPQIKIRPATGLEDDDDDQDGEGEEGNDENDEKPADDGALPELKASRRHMEIFAASHKAEDQLRHLRLLMHLLPRRVGLLLC